MIFFGLGRKGVRKANQVGPPASPGAYYDLVDASSNKVAWWPLDGALTDEVAARNLSVQNGSASYTTPLPADAGTAQSFNCAGTNTLSVAHNAALKPAVGSLMIWFEPTTVAADATVCGCNTTGQVDDHFRLLVTANGTVSAEWQYNTADTIIATSAGYMTAGQTVCAIATWDGSGVALYLDGNQIDTDSAHTTGLTNNTLAWRFGDEELVGNGIFNGVIDEIVLWNRVLSQNEVYELAQIGQGLP